MDPNIQTILDVVKYGELSFRRFKRSPRVHDVIFKYDGKTVVEPGDLDDDEGYTIILTDDKHTHSYENAPESISEAIDERMQEFFAAHKLTTGSEVIRYFESLPMV